jgi:hypothetical protein
MIFFLIIASKKNNQFQKLGKVYSLGYNLLIIKKLLTPAKPQVAGGVL